MNAQINLSDEITVDGFCGGGGWSTGFEFAIGRPVDIGINHDKYAIAMHKKNHPFTEHYNENIFEVDPYKATKGRPVGWAHFSPDCTHFSRAKGGTPVKKSIRGLAWVVTKWAGTVHPRIISMENVPEFMSWGSLCARRNKDGRIYRMDGTLAVSYTHLNAERARRNMTVEDLAKKIGISVRTFYTWQESGNIPATKLIAMAELFDCSIDYLLGRKSA